MRGVLLDLDGVVYVGDRPVPGAAEAIDWLVEQGIAHLFLTNTTSRPREAVVAKLAGFGLPVSPEEILTPAVSAVAWLRSHGITRPAVFVPAATVTEFAELDPLSDDLEEGAGAVVIGDLGAGWTFPTVNRAFRLLMSDPGIPLVALGMTRFWRAEDGLRLDAGAFVRALEYAAGRSAVVVGKPDPRFFRGAAGALQLPTDQVVMVGDDIHTDVEGAQTAGLAGVLVRTGKFSEADLRGGVTPDAVLGSLADLPRWWARP